MRAGCQGAITALGNTFPELINEIINSVSKEKNRIAESIQETLNQIRRVTETYPKIASIKVCVENYFKLPPTYVRSPLTNLNAGQKVNMLKSIDNILVKSNIT
jgi:dihydrodipicolinate synthase/N-acetylneuraminate lyase